MQRRDFLGNSSIGLLAALAADFLPLSEANAQTSVTGSVDSIPKKTFHITERLDPRRVKNDYVPDSKGLGGQVSPYVYLYYDEKASKFVSPLDLKAENKKASYTLQPVLRNFNIRHDDQAKFSKLQNQLQLGFNASAKNADSADLSWVFMNAIDIFLAKDDQGRQDQLTKFTDSAGKKGAALNSSPQIQVVDGIVHLQITAFGQHKDGFWTKFFDTITKAVKSPLATASLKGFGIPALASQAVEFVDGVLDTIADQNKLVPLWETGSLEFGITEDAETRFKMKQGLWAMGDSGYADSSNLLEGHTVDLRGETFRLFDKAKKPVDANYLMSDIKITNAPTRA